MNKEEVLKIALEQETIDNLLEGDIWVDLDIKTEEYPNGVFTQFEKKELENGEYSDDIYCVYGYKNSIEDGERVSNYDTTVFKFEFDKKELEQLNIAKNGVLPYTEFLEKDLKSALEIEKFNNKIIESGRENFNNVIKMYDELLQKYTDVIQVRDGLKAFVNSMSYDINALKKCDLTSEDARELKILEKVSSDLSDILNKDKSKNDNSALEQIRNEMNSTQVKEEAAQVNVRKKR
jgi:hypothetical protein